MSPCYHPALAITSGCLHSMNKKRDIADGFLKDRNPDELYESVLIPALLLTKRDRQRKLLDEERETVIYQMTRDLIEDIGEGIAESLEATEETPRPEQQPLPLILCIPAKDKADELIGIMLAQLLRRNGHRRGSRSSQNRRRDSDRSYKAAAGCTLYFSARAVCNELGAICVSQSVPKAPRNEDHTVSMAFDH